MESTHNDELTHNAVMNIEQANLEEDETNLKRESKPNNGRDTEFNQDYENSKVLTN